MNTLGPGLWQEILKTRKMRNAHSRTWILRRKLQNLKNKNSTLYDLEYDKMKNVEKQIDISTYSTYEQRVYGFLSEPLLDVWLERHPEYKTTEVDYVFMEHTNWLVKGGNFLKRKIVGHY